MVDRADVIQTLIEQWQPDVQLPPGDPLHIELHGTPTYLPLIQPKRPHSEMGRRSISVRVLGLTAAGEWAEDNRAVGEVSWVYGSYEQCFGRAPFALSPLRRARGFYPQLADLIWNEDEVAGLAARYLSDWQRVTAALASDSSIAVRSLGDVGVARALGLLELPHTVAVLIDALRSSAAVVRREAVYGLAHVTPYQGLAPIIAGLAADMALEVRAMVASALGRVGDVQSLDPLVVLLHDAAPVVQQAAIHALVELGYPQAREPILQLARAETEQPGGAIANPAGVDPDVRATALLALQTFWNENDTNLLLAALADQAPAVRAAAVYVL